MLEYSTWVVLGIVVFIFQQHRARAVANRIDSFSRCRWQCYVRMKQPRSHRSTPLNPEFLKLKERWIVQISFFPWGFSLRFPLQRQTLFVKTPRVTLWVAARSTVRVRLQQWTAGAHQAQWCNITHQCVVSLSSSTIPVRESIYRANGKPR